MFAPLNSSRSKPAWPSTVSLSSPGFQTNASSPAPIRAVSSPSPPLTRSPPWPPTSTSLPRPPFIRQLDRVGLERAGVDAVVAAEAVERQPVVRLLLEEDVDRRVQPEDVDAAGVARRAEHVGALGAVDGDRVGRAVAAAVRPAEVEPGLREVGAAQVADDDVVGSAECAEVDALDVVEVHRHRGDVPGEEDTAAVGDDVDVLGDVRAEEEQRVGAVLALERVVAVARVPLEHVVCRRPSGRGRCRCRRR